MFLPGLMVETNVKPLDLAQTIQKKNDIYEKHINHIFDRVLCKNKNT